VPPTAVCLRCGKDFDPAASGDPLFCASCAAARPRVSVTTVLLAINVLVFIAMVIGGVSPLTPTSEQLLRWGASYGPSELSTDWWRLFTAMFVHIGLIHIALNMLCLSNLGPLAERLFGSGKFLLLYLLTGLGGNVASVALHPTIVAAGASGAIFGVAGALLAVFHVRKIPAIASLRGRGGQLGIGGFIAYNLFYGFADSGIDNAAHIGGLVIGFLIGLSLPVAGSHAGRVAAWRTQGVLLATAIVLGGTFVGVRQWRRTYGEVETARHEVLAGNYATATERLKRVLEEEPHNLQARVLLGAVYLDQGQTADAIRELQLALREDSTNSFVLGALGSAYWALEQWEQAVAAYTRQTKVDFNDAEAFANLGGAYLNWGRAKDAIAPLERAARLAPDSARSHYNLGLALLEEKQYAPAVISFGRALQQEPDNPLALLKRGVAYELLGKRDSARADYRRVADAPEGSVSDDNRRLARRLLAELPRR